MGFVIGVGSFADIIIRGAAPPDWWDPNGVGLSCQAAYQARNAADYATSLTDLTGNGNLLVEGNGAVPWNPAQGWMFAGAVPAQWLDTGLIPANDQSWSVFCQYANDLGGNNYLVGVRSGNNRIFGLIARIAGNVRYYNGRFTAVPPALATGNLGVAGSQGYRNGIADGGPMAGWAGASTFSTYIGARNNAGVTDFFVSADIYAVAIYDAGPAAVQAEAAAISAAMTAL